MEIPTFSKILLYIPKGKKRERKKRKKTEHVGKRPASSFKRLTHGLHAAQSISREARLEPRGAIVFLRRPAAKQKGKAFLLTARERHDLLPGPKNVGRRTARPKRVLLRASYEAGPWESRKRDYRAHRAWASCCEKDRPGSLVTANAPRNCLSLTHARVFPHRAFLARKTGKGGFSSGQVFGRWMSR